MGKSGFKEKKWEAILVFQAKKKKKKRIVPQTRVMTVGFREKLTEESNDMQREEVSSSVPPSGEETQQTSCLIRSYQLLTIVV